MSFLKKLYSHPYHFTFVILYFLLSGWSENRGLIERSAIAQLALTLLLIGGISFLLFQRIFKCNYKSGLFTTILLVIGLFFGVAKDSLAGVPELAIFSRMNFMLIAIAAIVTILFFLIKRSSDQPKKLHHFLNLLFIIYILFDLVKLSFKVKQDTYSSETFAERSILLNHCDTCKSPDIYLVIADEYMGIKGLKEYFGYDDSNFVQFLKQKGFHVIPDPHSNYRFTVFSMASLLNMNYSSKIGVQNIENPFGYQLSIRSIRENLFCNFLVKQGYQVRNYSIFDLPSEPTRYHKALIPLKSELITNKTIFNQVMKAVPHVLTNTFKWQWYYNRIAEASTRNNEEMMIKSILPKDSGRGSPAFTYVHLSMPHEPYAFDRNGNKITINLNRNIEDDKSAYLDYLIYTNSRLKTYISNLIESTNGKAIILLLSDHGYRHSGIANSKSYLSVLNAVYLPEKNYAGWYDTISHVNHLRVLLNTVFDQKLSMLKDSFVE